MAEVGQVVDRRPAHVHGDLARLARSSRGAHGPGRGVVEAQHAGYGNPIMSSHRDRVGTDPVPGGRFALGAPAVPEKPTLDGPRGSAGRPSGRTPGTYRFDRSATRAEVFSIDTPPPTVSGSLHIGSRLLVHPHRRRRPLPAHAGRERLLPDGLGRQRPAHRAPGAELLRRPLRSRRSPTTPTSSRPTPPGKDAVAGQPAQLRRAVPRAHRRGRAGLRAPVAHARPVGRLDPRPTPPSTTAASRHEPARVPAQPGPRARPTRGGAHAVGRRLPDGGLPGRAGGPRAARRLPPAPFPASARRRVDIETTRPELAGRLRRAGRPPRRRALPRPVRHDRAHPAVRRARSRCWPTSWPTPRRARASP